MKIIFCFIFIFCATFCRAQSTGRDNQVSQAAPALTINVRQNGLTAKWLRAVNGSPTIADNWLQFYQQLQKDNNIPAAEKKEIIFNTLKGASQYIAASAEYQVMKFLESGKKDSVAIYSALEKSGHAQWVYRYAIHYAIIKQSKKERTVFCKELHAKGYRIPLDQMSYYKNVFNSLEQGATLYARGYDDLVPLAMLQEMENFRTDVDLRYYENAIESDKPFYLSLTLGSDIIGSYPNAAYTGLAIKVNATGALQELKNHFEHDFIRELVATGSSSEAIQLKKNYLPCLLLLFKQYKEENNTYAKQVKKIILTIATDAGVTNSLPKSITD